MKTGCTHCTQLGGSSCESCGVRQRLCFCPALGKSLCLSSFPHLSHKDPSSQGLAKDSVKYMTCFEKGGKGRSGGGDQHSYFCALFYFLNPVSPLHPTHHEVLPKTVLRFLPKFTALFFHLCCHCFGLSHWLPQKPRDCSCGFHFCPF